MSSLSSPSPRMAVINQSLLWWYQNTSHCKRHAVLILSFLYAEVSSPELFIGFEEASLSFPLHKLFTISGDGVENPFTAKNGDMKSGSRELLNSVRKKDLKKPGTVWKQYKVLYYRGAILNWNKYPGPKAKNIKLSRITFLNRILIS